MRGQANWPVAAGLIAAVFVPITVLTLAEFFEVLLWEPKELEDKSAAIRNIGLLLAAIFGLPFVIWRSIVAQKQVDLSKQSQITDRINKAVEGLGAEKTVTFQRKDKDGNLTYERYSNGKPNFAKPVIVTETRPNIEVRIGAIYALERIAQDSDRDHVKIMEILCAYVRENAPASEAKSWPEIAKHQGEIDETLKDDWYKRASDFEAAQLEMLEGLKLREDIQVVLNVIGRRSLKQRGLEAAAVSIAKKTEFTPGAICPDLNDFIRTEKSDHAAYQKFSEAIYEWKNKLATYKGYRLDLRQTNLRGADLSQLNLNGARLEGSELQGARLKKVSFRDANIRASGLQKTSLEWALLEGADLSESQLQGADLFQAQLFGTNFSQANLQRASLIMARAVKSNFQEASLYGASLSGAQLQDTNLSRAQLQLTNLYAIQMNKETFLKGTNFTGASIKSVNDKTLAAISSHLSQMFGDASTLAPASIDRPNHWPVFILKVYEKRTGERVNRFREEWAAWHKKGHTYNVPTKVDEANGVFPYVEDTND